MDKNHKLIKKFSTEGKENKLDIKTGMNQFNWNLMYPEAEKADGMILWNGEPSGIIAAPGNYFAKVKIGNDSAEVSFVVLADPNYTVTKEGYEAQFELLQKIQDKYNVVQKTVKDIRVIRTQINDFVGRQGKDMPKEVKLMADSVVKKLTGLEEKLHQTKAKSGQDVLNYPIRLNDKLSGLFDVVNSGKMPPSKQALEVFTDLSQQADVVLNQYKEVLNTEVPLLNKMIRDQALPVIGLK
jgi:hypothetical protein